MKINPEKFESYRGRNNGSSRWCAPLELAILHQRFNGGGDSGLWRHDDFYALYVVCDGRGIHIINGHPYGIARGDVYLTPPGTFHGYRDYHNLCVEAFCFQSEFFRDEELDALRALPGFWQLMTPLEREEFRDYHLHLAPETLRAVEAMLDELFNELETPRDEVAPLLARGLFFRLLVFLAREHAQRKTPERRNVSTHKTNQMVGPRVADVLRFCESHFAQPLSVAQLAAMMFLSPARFSEKFTREVGMPPMSYIRHLRLQRAQSLLRESELSVTQIAQSCGFGDSAQFSKAFRAQFQISPSDYRRNNRRNT
jgi:AraC-like DNA-binding protein